MARIPSSRVFISWLAPAVTLALTGCGPSGAPGGHAAPGGFPPAVVATVTVQPQDLPVTYEYPAQTAGYREVEVRARVTGILEKRNYREGALV